MIAFRAKSISFSYDVNRVVEDVTLSLTESEFVGIIGPNGAGKSTMLRLMCGILKPAAGEIELFGAELSGQPQRKVAQRVAFVPQETHFALNFAVEEVVMTGRYPYQRPFAREKKEDFEAVNNAINVAAVDDLRKRPVNSLSSGERQRVVIARALAQSPQMLLLDEPTSHLDLHHQCAIMELLKKLNTRGLTVVVVHHDLNLASLYCQRLVLMHRGRVKATGTPHELIKQKILKEVYETEVLVMEHPDKGVPQVFLRSG
ncbi:MAG: heme ABC transporter ATP-binding protein [candidate division WOR-3 bacterium]|nr:MAG: heme ABC transporter ATP-binding protein [candidate division WOR-3 bacterium]